MPEFRVDQADGLRRLFRRGQPQIITFASGHAGAGKSQLVANVASVLARQGKEVLIVDENAHNSIATVFGLRARSDLMKVLEGASAVDEALIRVSPGVRLLQAALAVQRLATLTNAQREMLLHTIGRMTPAPDIVLVDTSRSHPLGFSPFGLVAHDTVMVLSANGDAITETYALIKKVSLGYARKHFRLVVTRARSQDEAMAIFGNIAHVTKSRRIARLEYAGSVPCEAGVIRQSMRLAQPATCAFPDAAVSRSYKAIASNLLTWPTPDDSDGGIEQFLQQLLNLSQHIDPVPIYA